MPFQATVVQRWLMSTVLAGLAIRMATEARRQDRPDSARQSTAGKNIVNNAGEGCRGVDDRRIAGRVFFRFVQSQDQRAFVRLAAKFVARSVSKTFFQCSQIDIENEDAIEPIDKVVDIP